MSGINWALTEDMSQLLSSVVVMTFSVKKTCGIRYRLWLLCEMVVSRIRKRNVHEK